LKERIAQWQPCRFITTENEGKTSAGNEGKTSGGNQTATAKPTIDANEVIFPNT